MYDLKQLVMKVKREGLSDVNAEARVCQDISKDQIACVASLYPSISCVTILLS